jgi:hypothetical protein
MTDLVGVEDGGAGLLIPTPKRDLLLFDRIAVFRLDDYIAGLREGLHPEPSLAADFEWLAGRGIIFDPGFPGKTEIDSIQEYRELVLKISSRIKQLNDNLSRLTKYITHTNGTVERIEPDKHTPPMAPDDCFRLNNEIGSLRTRLIADYLTRIGECDACSLWPLPEQTPQIGVPLNKSNVIQLLLTKFPVPDDFVPLEEIVNFQNNEATIKMRTSLRRWIYGVVRNQMTRSEADAELSDLIIQYETAMDIAHLRYSHGLLEVASIMMAELLENLLNIKPGKALKSLFDIRRRHADLLEAETKAPGREISLVSRARKEFCEKR